MALDSVSFALQFTSTDPDRVDENAIGDRLGVTADYPIPAHGHRSGGSAVFVVEFPTVSVEGFGTDVSWEDLDDERYERMAEDVERLQELISVWVEDCAEELVELRADGVKGRLIGNLWLDADQLDLVLMPRLMLACGSNDIEIYLLSNE